MKKVIALGFFDGVHLGHAALLRQTAARASELDAAAAACTFDVHPASRITGERVPLLTTPDQRARLMEALWGIREVIVTPFDEGMRRMPWEEYITGYLVGRHGACHLVCGEDYRFGYRGEGTSDKLRALCARLGLGCDIIPPVLLEGEKVSSSAIRREISEGRVDRAARLLGRPFAVEGTVAHGKGLGGKLGFPTVNLTADPALALPGNGVYAARAILPGGEGHPAVTNIGVRPTFQDGDGVTVESFLLDFTGDLYGQSVTLELYRQLRRERAFPSLGALKAQIRQDAQAARAILPED